MKTNRLCRSITGVAVLALLAAFSACSRNNSSNTSAQTAANSPDQVLKNQTADVEQRTNAELNDWDRRIDQLKAERKRVKSKALKDEWDNAIADLGKKRDTVKNRLSDVKSAGADTWQQANSNLDLARADLANSYDQVVAKLGKTVTPPLHPEPAL